MSRLLYADSGALIALLYRRDRHHRQVSEHFRTLRRAGDVVITSDPVIAETVTRLRYDAGLQTVLEFERILAAATANGSLVVRESDEELRHAAFAVLRRYADLDLSYADAVGGTIARDRHVDAVFGLDNDFRVMGFDLEPT